MIPDNETEIVATRMPIPRHVWQDYVQIGLLLCLVLLGVPVNVASIVKSLLFRSKRKSAKSCHLTLLKIHLAFVDLMILTLCALSKAAWLGTLRWMGGDWLCKLLKFCQTFAVVSNSNLVTVIAIDRVHTVKNIRKVHNKQTFRRLNSCVVVAYVLAGMISLPQLYVWETVNPFSTDPKWSQCVTLWASDRILHTNTSSVSFYIDEQFYSIVSMVVSFYIPFAIIAVSYLSIFFNFRSSIKESTEELMAETRQRTLSRASSLRHESASTMKKRITEEPESVCVLMHLLVVLKAPNLLETKWIKSSYSLTRLIKAKKISSRKSAYVLVAYIVCWSPYNVLGLMSFIHPVPVTSVYRILFDFIAVNAVINPLVYGL